MSQLHDGNPGPKEGQQFSVADLGCVEWWARQFTETENCAPGGVLLIFGGPNSLSPLAAAWFIAAWCVRISEEEFPFSKIIHIVPPKSRLRDEKREICTSVKRVLATQGTAQGSQDAAAAECASRCFVSSDGDDIIRHLGDVPEFATVAISCAERVRFRDLEVVQDNVVTTHTGLHLNFALEEELMLPHLWKLLENLLRLSAERKIAVVALVETFGPTLSPIPQQILASRQFAFMQVRRSESDASTFTHFTAAEEMRKTAGIEAARAYLEKNIPALDERALAVAGLLGRSSLFSAAWQVLVPHVQSICEHATGRILLNLAQAAAAAGVAKEAISFVEASWAAGLDVVEDLNSAAILARELNAVSVRGPILEAMKLYYPEHRWTLARNYEWLLENGSLTEAAVLARKVGNEFDALCCELRSSEKPEWNSFLERGTIVGRRDEALLFATWLALERGELQRAREFIALVSKSTEAPGARVRLLIQILTKELATTEENELQQADEDLNEIFDYVASHPEDTETRLDLTDLFEASLPDLTAIVLLAYRCGNTFNRWRKGAADDAIGFGDDPLSIAGSGDSMEAASSFMEALYRNGQSNVIGVGSIPTTTGGAIDANLLTQLGTLLSFAAGKGDTKLMVEVLHGICIVCQSLGNADSDYIAGLHAMGAFIQCGKVQDALNLSETMLLFWPATQPQFEGARKAHGWAAMSDAYLRSQNPITALLYLCLSLQGMMQAPVKQHVSLFRHKLRLGARIFRELRVPPLGRQFLEMERQFVLQHPNEKAEIREMAVLELSYDLTELTSSTPVFILERILKRCGDLLRDDTEIQWEPIVSFAASAFSECRDRGVEVSTELWNLFSSRLGRCKPRVQNLVRRHLNVQPRLVDVEAALRDLQGGALFDDQGFQLRILDGFLRRAVATACERNDCDLFLAATTLLSQPAVTTVRSRRSSNTKLTNCMPKVGSTTGDIGSAGRLADYAAATHFTSVGNEIRFADISLFPISAVRNMACPGETFCILAYDSSRHLCQLLIDRDKVVGPRRLPETVWSAAKHLRWSRYFPDHYAWKQETDYGVIEERPTIAAVKTSLKYLGIDIPSDRRIITVVPEAELFGFPFVITESDGSYLGEGTRCATVPSLPWLASVKQANAAQSGKLEAWLGSTTKSPFDVLKVRDGLAPIVRCWGGTIYDTDTPETLEKADVAILLSHGGHSRGRGFQGIAEEYGRFTINDLAGWLGKCKCVILFVCHAGRSDDRLYNQETFGLVARLFRREVRVVIAPPWPLNTRIPALWLAPFLAGLMAGQTVRGANAGAADAVRSQFSHPCAWAAMQVFGDAECRFTNAPTGYVKNVDGIQEEQRKKYGEG
jgi:hypothetical protein